MYGRAIGENGDLFLFVSEDGTQSKDFDFGAERQQRARQPAGTGTDFDNRRIFERARGARDPRGEVEVQQEILTKRFSSREGMLANDLAKRRKVIDRAHAGCAAAMRAARRNAAIRLDGLARPVPAMSKAVP